jgi:hypothetical protein
VNRTLHQNILYWLKLFPISTTYFYDIYSYIGLGLNYSGAGRKLRTMPVSCDTLILFVICLLFNHVFVVVINVVKPICLLIKTLFSSMIFVHKMYHIHPLDKYHVHHYIYTCACTCMSTGECNIFWEVRIQGSYRPGKLLEYEGGP